MDVIKKYPTFFAIIGVCLLIFIAGLVFIFLSMGGVNKAKSQYDAADRTYRASLGLNPAPTTANLEESEQNIVALEAALETQVASTRAKANNVLDEPPPTDPTTIQVQLEAFVTQFTRDAKTVEPWGAAPGQVGIKLPEGFDFGFSRFLDSGVPPEAEFIPVIFEQKQILSYILRRLYEGRPFSIEKIQRETQVVDLTPSPRQGAAVRNTQRDDEFVMGSNTAKVEGAIETLAFRLEFTGYTPTLRSFLKELQKFELPLVVRSVEVEPVAVTQEQASRTSRFEQFFQGEETEETEDEASKEPLVMENLSRFTVEVEFINVLVKSPDDIAALDNAGDSQPL